MKIKLDSGAYIPERAHETDAGLDLRSTESVWIYPTGCSAVIDTGVHIELPKGYYGQLQSKSGLNVNKDLVSFGTIDEGYTGSIKVKLYNLGHTPREIKQGDKISQLVIMPYIAPDLEQVDRLDETDRGNDGFGSTGR